MESYFLSLFLSASWGWSERSELDIPKSLFLSAPNLYNKIVHYVYVLQSLKKSTWLYKGSTSDLKRRFQEHSAGKNFSTAPYAPFRLIYYEAYLLKSDAEARERYFKTSMGKRVIKKQLSNYLKLMGSE